MQFGIVRQVPKLLLRSEALEARFGNEDRVCVITLELRNRDVAEMLECVHELWRVRIPPACRDRNSNSRGENFPSRFGNDHRVLIAPLSPTPARFYKAIGDQMTI